MGTSHSSLAVPHLPDQLAKSGVPPVIQARLKKSWTKLTIHLSEPGAEPSYCATFPDGWWGVMTLHNGPSETDRAIAHSVLKGKMMVDNIISLPPPTAGDASLDGKEILRHKWRVGSEKFWFAMDVGEGAARRVERFEWRHSRGQEVKSMGQGSFGWKLVRLDPGDPEDEDADAEDGDLEGYKEFVRGGGHGKKGGDAKEDEDEMGREGAASRSLTKDGREIVAVWADASVRKMSMTNVGELQFRGAGATGEFGTRWALMAVMTCLSMWQKAAAAASAS